MINLNSIYGNKVASEIKLVKADKSGKFVSSEDQRVFAIKNLQTALEAGILSTTDGKTLTVLKPEAISTSTDERGITVIRTRETLKEIQW